MSEFLLNLAEDAFAKVNHTFNARLELVARDHKVLCVLHNKTKIGDSFIFETTVNEITQGLCEAEWRLIQAKLRKLRKEDIL